MTETKINRLLNRQSRLYARLDNLDGCEDNPVYADEIREIQRQLNDIELAFSEGAEPW